MPGKLEADEARGLVEKRQVYLAKSKASDQLAAISRELSAITGNIFLTGMSLGQELQ